jgi:hypothetical protein
MNKLTKVSDSFTVNRYDNGWMFEVNGRNEKDEWRCAKIVCNTEEELLALIKQYNKLDLE